MSYIPPLILGAASLLSFVAAYWHAPAAGEDGESLTRRFNVIHNSLNDLGLDMDNSMMARLYSQVEIIMGHLSSQMQDADGRARILSDAELKGLVQVATQTRSVVESLLQCRTLHKMEEEHAPRVGADPEGVTGMTGIRQWILGGMRAELERETKSKEYAEEKQKLRRLEAEQIEKRKAGAKFEQDAKTREKGAAAAYARAQVEVRRASAAHKIANDELKRLKQEGPASAAESDLAAHEADVKRLERKVQIAQKYMEFAKKDAVVLGKKAVEAVESLSKLDETQENELEGMRDRIRSKRLA